MRTALAVVVALASLAGMGVGIAWCAAVAVARRVFERSLASGVVDGVKLQASELIERIRSPLLRRIVNQRTGELAGQALVALIRDDLSRRMMLGLGVATGGFVLAFLTPNFQARRDASDRRAGQRRPGHPSALRHAAVFCRDDTLTGF